jgi:hypothetical protein
MSETDERSPRDGARDEAARSTSPTSAIRRTARSLIARRPRDEERAAERESEHVVREVDRVLALAAADDSAHLDDENTPYASAASAAAIRTRRRES